MDYKASINERISYEIKDMGFNFNHLGTMYLIETIEVIYNSKDSNYLRSIEKTVYNILAERHSKNPSTIKSNIIKATNCMYEKNLKEKKNEGLVFDYDIYYKYTPKEIIKIVLTKLEA